MFLSRLRHRLGFGPTVAVVAVGAAVALLGLREADFEVSKARTVKAVALGCRSNVCVDQVRRKGDECYKLAAKPAPLRNRLDHDPWRTSWFFDVDQDKFSNCIAGNGVRPAPRTAPAIAEDVAPDAGSPDGGARDANGKGAP